MDLEQALNVMRDLEKTAEPGQTFTVQTRDGRYFSVQVVEGCVAPCVLETPEEVSGFVLLQLLTRPMR